MFHPMGLCTCMQWISRGQSRHVRVYMCMFIRTYMCVNNVCCEAGVHFFRLPRLPQVVTVSHVAAKHTPFFA